MVMDQKKIEKAIRNYVTRKIYQRKPITGLETVSNEEIDEEVRKLKEGKRIEYDNGNITLYNQDWTIDRSINEKGQRIRDRNHPRLFSREFFRQFREDQRYIRFGSDCK